MYVQQTTATNSLSDVLTEEFQRWREGDTMFTPVRLSMDPEGFFLYEQPRQQSLIGEAKPRTYDLMVVSDCSPGRIRRCRPLNQLIEQLYFEQFPSNYEDCYFCLVYRQQNMDSSVQYFISPSYTYFLHSDPSKINSWCQRVNSFSFNQQHLNGDTFCHLRKVRCQLLFEATEEIIRCSEIARLMSLPREQEKVVESAMAKIGLLEEGGPGILKEQLTEQVMWTLYMELCPRPDMDKIFLGLLAVEKSQIEFLSLASFLQFINNTQWDPRVNDQLVQKMKERTLKQLLRSLSIFPTEEKTITNSDFQKYLHSYLNSILPLEELRCPPSLPYPLCSYFINSSHNTYLTGNQLKSASTVEMYIQALLLGARCIELDCWDSSTGEPVITHGNTLCTKISFEEVIRAIGEFAFLKSDFPVILSFENHCSPSQQQLMARFCVKYLGTSLCTLIPSHPLAPGVKLPSPSDLRGKIIIKNKKVRPDTGDSLSPKCKRMNKFDFKKSGKQRKVDKPPEVLVNQNSCEERGEEWEGTSEVDMELSDLVNYVEPVKFKSIDDSMERDLHWEMSSFSEVRGLVLLQQEGAKFIRYNSTHTSRIYPAGSRISSSNYMPQIYWNVGCQMVALNYQTPDLPMQINQAKFELGGNCGYLLKPKVLRVEKSDRNVLEPFTQSPPEHTIPTDCGIRVISAHFLGPATNELMVLCEVFGLPADTHRRRGKDNTTRSAYYNGVWATWDEERYIWFEEIFSQELALLKITIQDETGTAIAHRIIPVSLLRNGYRHIYLRDRFNLPLGLGSLFVQVHMRDHVTEGLEGFAKVLKNPEHLVRGSMAETRLESNTFKREAIKSLLVGEDEVEELQEILDRMGTHPSPVSRMRPRKGRTNPAESSEDVQSCSRRTTDTHSPALIPLSYTRSFDYGNIDRPMNIVSEPQLINSEFIPAIKSITSREQIVPQGLEAVIAMNKAFLNKQERVSKEMALSAKVLQKQIDTLEQDMERQLKDISSSYDKEVQKVERELTGKLAGKLTQSDREKLEQKRINLLQTKELKLTGVKDQAFRDIREIQYKQEREEAQMELETNMELKLSAIPLVKAAHQNQRQQVLEKIHEFERKNAEKEIESKKIGILNDLLGKTGTLCSETATLTTVKVFVQHQTTELERLQSQEGHMFERESNNIIKQLERDVKELELKFEQFETGISD